MIIDGNVIASNHMWGFACGCVPFIISNAKCWFTEFLIPHVNYIPIQYDLSDLKEKIEWVINNDSEAEKYFSLTDFRRFRLYKLFNPLPLLTLT